MKIARLRILALIWLTVFVVSPALAKTITGLEIGDGVELPLTFKQQYLLIRVPRRQADYAISLVDADTNEVLKFADHFSYFGFDEILLVRVDECRRCVVRITGSKSIDKASPYKISLIDVVRGGRSEVEYSAWIETLARISNSGILYAKAENSTGTERKALLNQAERELQAIGNLSLAPQDNYWRNHATLILGYVSYLVGTEGSFKRSFRTVIERTSGTDSVPRIVALYSLASMEPDATLSQQMYTEAIAIALRLGDPLAYAKTVNLQAMNHVSAGDIDRGLELFKEAYDIFESESSWRDMLEPLHNLSWANLRARSVPAALSYAAQLKLLAEQLNDEENVLWALYDLGRAYGQLGERFIADDYLDQAMELNKALSEHERSSTHVLEAYLYEEKAEAFLRYGAFDLAKDFAVKMKSAYRDLQFSNRVADADYTLGEITLAQGNLAAAKDTFSSSLSYNKKNNRVRAAGKSALKLAELSMAQDDNFDAAKYQIEAMALLRGNGDRYIIARALSQAVNVLIHLNQIQRADELAENYGKIILEYGDEQELARFAIHRARIANALGRGAVAVSHVSSAKTIIENALPKVRHTGLRQTYLGMQRDLFELDVEYNLATASVDPLTLLPLVEAFKARTLAESIGGIDLERTASVEQRERRSDLLKKIDENAVSWYKNTDDTVAKMTIASSRELSFELQKIETEIANRRLPVRQQHAFETDLSVGSHELIAYFFSGQKNSYLWSISQSKILFHTLPSESEISRLVDNALQIISEPPGARQNVSAWEQNKILEKLSQMILHPLNEQLKSENIKHITVIPDGSFQGFPFGVLKLEGSPKPIVTDYSVSYAPSLLVRSRLAKKALSKNPQSIAKSLVVADPVFDGSGSTFEKLPFAKMEATAVKTHKGKNTIVLQGSEASKKIFLGSLVQITDTLHFATHGVLNEKEPALSGLLFAEENGDDSFWLAPAIGKANINAELVVLSACKSSTGKAIAGEGLMSLSRAFIEGGAHKVIGSLWNVQDQSTASLMDAFYQYRAESNPNYSEALQRAQVAILSNSGFDWSDPYYWAGFQLIGTNEELGYDEI